MKKRDYTLSFLYFFGILMVIDCHTGFGLSFLSNLFPYDSFFMPLFFFCSGYFFTRKPPLFPGAVVVYPTDVRREPRVNYTPAIFL